MPCGLQKIITKQITLFVVNGILFNHECPRRPKTVVTNKIVKRSIKIKKTSKNVFLWKIWTLPGTGGMPKTV